MKTIKVKFVDMWDGFDPKNSFLYKALLHSGYPIELSEEPDYLICSVFGHEALESRYDNCIKIVRISECMAPDFALNDYAVGMECLQFGDRYLRFPSLFLDAPSDKTIVEEVLNKGKNLNEDLANKTDFCSFVYSNSLTADPTREQLFRELCKYKKVNSGGRFLNNIGLPDGVPDKLAFQRKHKFVIACENTSHPGYLTEKLLDAFAAHAVPIYWGDPLVKETFNEKAFICAHDYPTMDALIERVREVDEDDELYARMLAEPAFLNPDANSLEIWQETLDAFIKVILDQPKETAFRRIRYAFGKSYLLEMRHAFYPTPVRDVRKKVVQGVKGIVPVSVKRRIKSALQNRK